MQNRFESKNLRWLFAFAVVAAIYIFARWRNLTASCLWFDEIFGVHAATHDWREMFRFVALDLIHPPLFYVFLKIWILIGGESLAWLRFFPVFWSILAIAPFLLLCRELKIGKTAALAGFALAATNGALVRYAQEVRMYSLLFCLALWSTFWFARFVERNSKTNLIWLTAINLLLVYTHYFGWLFVAAELIAICFFYRTKIRQFLVSIAILTACFAPWMWAIWRAAPTENNLAQNIGWQAKPGLFKIWQFLLALVEPFYYQQSSVDQAHNYLIAAPLALVFLAAILLNAKHEKAKPLLALALAPVALAFAASWLAPVSIWGTRHLIVVFALFALLVAVALESLPHKNTKTVVFVLVACLISIAGAQHFLTSPPTFIWCGWRELAARANESEAIKASETIESDEPATIYAFEDDAAYYLWHALKDNGKFRVRLINGYADMPKDRAYFLPRGFADVEVSDKNQLAGQKFWLAFRDQNWNPNKQVLTDLRARNYKISQPLEFRAQGIAAFLVKVEK